MARLQARPQCHQLLPLGIKLDGLVEPTVSHPDVAIQVDSQAVGHEELVTAPAGKHLSCILHAQDLDWDVTCSVTQAKC